jgi:hypothetical protein
LGEEPNNTGNIPTRPIEIANKPRCDWIGTDIEDDGNGGVYSLNRASYYRSFADRNNDSNWPKEQVGR